MQDNTRSVLLTNYACAILNPGLRAILIFDAPGSVLQECAQQFSQLIQACTRQAVEQVYLSTQENENDLWGSLHLPYTNVAAEPEMQRRPLPFSRQRSSATPQLIILPDLTRLSLTAARACIMQIDTPVVHLERNGQEDCWQPEQYWLASCPQDQIGAISPHLLDRFSLRLRWHDPLNETKLNATQRAEELFNLLQVGRTKSDTEIDYTEQAKQIYEARQRTIQILPEARERLLDYAEQEENIYPRRELALARFTVAYAKLQENNELTVELVDKAASHFGLSLPSTEEATGSEETAIYTGAGTRSSQENKIESESLSSAQQTTIQTHTITQQTAESNPAALEIKEGETITASITDAISAAEYPYLEDYAPILREAAALKNQRGYSSNRRSNHGPIIGYEPTNDLTDLALINTLLTAAKYRRLRAIQHTLVKSNTPEPLKAKQQKKTTKEITMATLFIEPTDLQKYRRAIQPEEMLLILLDYTSLKHCNWQDELLPYLSTAYIKRAEISIIKVGASDAQSPLQAELISARSILVPRIERALEQQSGKATPLAHGFELALQILQRTLQHGRHTVQNVTFVAITDGRGNVPLAASQKNQINQRQIIAREGIEDTLSIARQIHILQKHVTAFVLDPQPEIYPDLPQTLADALGARCIPIARQENSMEGHE